MRIGIDAKSYFQGPVSTQIVLRNIIPQLFKLFPQQEWIVFLDKKDKHLPFPFEGANITLQYVWADNNLLSNLFILPQYIKKLSVRTTLFQMFPSFNNKLTSMAFVHDVLFREFPQFFTWKERLYFFPMMWLTRRAARIVATTSYVADDLVKLGYVQNRSHIDIVPLGVSAEFKPAEQHNSNWLKQVSEKFALPSRFVLFVGRLNVRKNIENLLRALPLLYNPTIAVVIVGKEDWKSPNLQSLLLDPQIKRRIIFTGGVTNEELSAIYALAKIFCFPSYAEGFGLPPLEAMASGVPVVVSDRTALPEVCGDAAVYINPEEPQSIADGINLLLTDENIYTLKRNAGLKRARLFSWKNSATQLMESIMKTSNPSTIDPTFIL